MSTKRIVLLAAVALAGIAVGAAGAWLGLSWAAGESAPGRGAKR